MKLMRQMAVLEDEVNVAAWHPFPGGGMLYGTKEGKLRLFRHDRCARWCCCSHAWWWNRCAWLPPSARPSPCPAAQA